MQLVIKCDGLKIDDLYNGKNIFSFFGHDILYYYIKMCLNIVHDYTILKAFQVFLKLRKHSEIIGSNASYEWFWIISTH